MAVSSHERLFASDLLSLLPHPHLPATFCCKGRPLLKAEMVGVVVSLDSKERFVRFALDDGSGVVPCILWTNHSTSRYFNKQKLKRVQIEVQAELALEEANEVKLGRLLRVQGRITCFNQQRQLTVGSLQPEIDANAEVLHWLDCIRLALSCYDTLPPCLP
eukprot:c27779_g1_i1 orf=41-523(+)